MNFTKILDSNLGRDARAFVASLAGVITALVLVLRDALDVTNALPSSALTAKIAALLVGALALIGRFTKIGNTSGGVQ